MAMHSAIARKRTSSQGRDAAYNSAARALFRPQRSSYPPPNSTVRNPTLELRRLGEKPRYAGFGDEQARFHALSCGKPATRAGKRIRLNVRQRPASYCRLAAVSGGLGAASIPLMPEWEMAVEFS